LECITIYYNFYIGGRGGRQNFFDYYIACISPNIEGISPIYFYNKRILSDCEENIARLAKTAQQSGGGGGSCPPPPPRTPMHVETEYNNILLFIYLKYETAAGCRKPFLCCDVSQFLTPSAVIISMSSWRLIFFNINVIRVGIDKNQ
jgi:hypothetical protein